MFAALLLARFTLAGLSSISPIAPGSAPHATHLRAGDSPTVVYVVRHAEKSQADPRDRDPALSPAGAARSRALRSALQSASIDAVFATEYRRTQETVHPAAAAHGLSVTVAEARNPAALVSRVTGELRGKSILIAGHSNTVPALIEALGIANPPALSESDYDDLFVMTIPTGDAAPILMHLHYGAPDPDPAAIENLVARAQAMLDDFHDAAARADEQRYFDHFEPDALFLGTDATERWTVEQFRDFAMPYFERESAWTYTPVEREVSVSADLEYAWFDEQLDSAKYGRCRGTGVLHYSDGRWRVAQYHLTMPVPNDLALDLAERIRNSDKADK